MQHSLGRCGVARQSDAYFDELSGGHARAGSEILRAPMHVPSGP